MQVPEIDTWILDVEGAEESVLNGTDFSVVRFNVILLECDGFGTTAQDKQKMSILEANNFKCGVAYRNCICKNNAFTSHHSAPVKSIFNYKDGMGRAKNSSLTFRMN